jgi:hypothetical protein
VVKGLKANIKGKTLKCHDNANIKGKTLKCHDNANLKGKMLKIKVQSFSYKHANF